MRRCWDAAGHGDWGGAGAEGSWDSPGRDLEEKRRHRDQLPGAAEGQAGLGWGGPAAGTGAGGAGASGGFGVDFGWISGGFGSGARTGHPIPGVPAGGGGSH